MKTFEVRNVTDAVAKVIPYLLSEGVEETSRNGAVLVAPHPVITTYECPKERVLFGAARDANPFFHLMESLWMLAGRNDLAFPLIFNKRFYEYSDDGETVFGAYGWRWREFFGQDQLDMICEELSKNPNSRRCVLSMWNGYKCEEHASGMMWTGKSDLEVAMSGGKDVPCNTHTYFDMRGGRLNMTVCNRSNDAIWGAYGANVVHFSFLQEFMASRLGVEVGAYRQFSNNLHAYTDVYSREKLAQIAEEASAINPYVAYGGSGYTIPLGKCDKEWHEHLYHFLDTGFATRGGDNFFAGVAEPMYRSWIARKNEDTDVALGFLEAMPPSDWKSASLDWTLRRLERNNHAA